MIKTTTVLTACVLTLVATTASATTIYEHSFSGSDTDALDGVGVELGTGAGTLWTAEAAWFADGHVEVGVDGFDNANAYLPFTPADGNVYTLTSTLTAAGDTANFMTLSFMNNPTVDTLSTDLGGPWMLKRGPGGGLDNEVYSVTEFLTGLVNHGPFAGATELSMALDTRPTQWTVEYFINGASVRGPEAFATNPTITHVGVTRYVNPVTGAVSSFSLTAVPEPSTFAIAGVAVAIVAVIGRSRNRLC